MSIGTAVAKIDPNQIDRRFVGNIVNSRMVVQTNHDGFLQRTMTWTRLFEDTDLYSAKQPNYDVWGPGVSKLCAALGARVTPLPFSPDPDNAGQVRPGKRITRDEVSGVLRSIEQDVLLEMRHPQTGSPIKIIATGQVDTYHLLMGELERLADRDDISRIVTDRIRQRMELDTDYDTWAFYPYSLGAWLGVNLANKGAREAMAKHRELVREDKVIGKAVSKAVRLALKQANVVPMRVSKRAMMEDAAGRLFIDVPTPCWATYEDRGRLEQAIHQLVDQMATQAIEVEFVTEGDEGDLEILAEQGQDAPRQLPESLPPQEVQVAPPKPELVLETKAAAAKPHPASPVRDPAPKNIGKDRRRALQLETLLLDEQGLNAIVALRSQCDLDDEIAIAEMTDADVVKYVAALRSVGRGA